MLPPSSHDHVAAAQGHAALGALPPCSGSPSRTSRCPRRCSARRPPTSSSRCCSRRTGLPRRRTGAERHLLRVPHHPPPVAARWDDAEADLPQGHDPARAVHAEAVARGAAGAQAKQDVALGGRGRGGGQEQRTSRDARVSRCFIVDSGRKGSKIRAGNAARRGKARAFPRLPSIYPFAAYSATSSRITPARGSGPHLRGDQRLQPGHAGLQALHPRVPLRHLPAQRRVVRLQRLDLRRLQRPCGPPAPARRRSSRRRCPAGRWSVVRPQAERRAKVLGEGTHVA